MSNKTFDNWAGQLRREVEPGFAAGAGTNEEWLKRYLMDLSTAHNAQTVDGKRIVGSDLSRAIDWLVETLKGYFAGYDWHKVSLQAQLTAVNVLLTNVVPALEAQGGVLGSLATLALKPFLISQKARIEAELALPTPPPEPAPG